MRPWRCARITLLTPAIRARDPRSAGKRSKVLEDLVRTRPLRGRNDNVDIAMSAAIKRMISDTRRVHTERSQLVAPGHGCALILKRANRLPPVKPRIPNRHRRFFGGTTQEAKTTHFNEGTQASLATSACGSAALEGTAGI